MRAFLLFTIFICGLFAADKFPYFVAKQTATDTERLNTDLKIWQVKLGLSDWKINLKIVGKNGVASHAVGGIWWNVPTHISRIRVLDRKDYSRVPQRGFFADQRITVLHELVHLLRIQEEESDAEEEEVERLAKNYYKEFTKQPAKITPVILVAQ